MSEKTPQKAFDRHHSGQLSRLESASHLEPQSVEMARLSQAPSPSSAAVSSQAQAGHVAPASAPEPTAIQMDVYCGESGAAPASTPKSEPTARDARAPIGPSAPAHDGAHGSAIKGILFDIDGVIVDSEPFLLEACKLFFKKRGVAVQRSDFLPFVGRGENRYIGGVAEKHHVPIEIESAKREVYALYEEIALGRIKTPLGMMRPMAGVGVFIQRAKNAGLKTALASSADLAKVRINLRAAGFAEEDFDCVLSGNAVERKKPHPDIYLLAAANIGLGPEECLVFDDAESGCAAGRRAGCRCVGVLGSFSRKALVESGAQAVVRDFTLISGFQTGDGLKRIIEKLVQDETMAHSSQLNDVSKAFDDSGTL